MNSAKSLALRIISLAIECRPSSGLSMSWPALRAAIDEANKTMKPKIKWQSRDLYGNPHHKLFAVWLFKGGKYLAIIQVKR